MVDVPEEGVLAGELRRDGRVAVDAGGEDFLLLEVGRDEDIGLQPRGGRPGAEVAVRPSRS